MPTFQPSSYSYGAPDGTDELGWALKYPITQLIVTSQHVPNFPISPFTIAHLSSVSDFMGRLPWPRKDVTISSGFRNVLVNSLVGGVSDSDHTKGTAVDFSVQGLTNRQVGAFLWLNRDKIRNLRQVIVYTNTGHVHVGLGEPQRRFLIGAKGGSYSSWTPSESDLAAVRHLKLGWDWIWPKRLAAVGFLGGCVWYLTGKPSLG